MAEADDRGTTTNCTPGAPKRATEATDPHRPANQFPLWGPQLDGYARAIEDLAHATAGNVDERRAKAVIEQGFDLISRIRKFDQDWAREVRAGAVAFNWNDSRAICDACRRWYESSRLLVNSLRHFRSPLVESSEYLRLRDLCREVYFTATADVERLKGAVEEVARHQTPDPVRA